VEVDGRNKRVWENEESGRKGERENGRWENCGIVIFPVGSQNTKSLKPNLDEPERNEKHRTIN